MENRGLTVEDAELIIDPVVEFPELNTAFERIRPITDFRRDNAEARILYICRPIRPLGLAENGDGRDELYVLKCKIQTPSALVGGLIEPVPGPSEHTLAELKALNVFTDSGTPSLPHLIGWRTATQGPNGPMPGGYIAYIVMTLLPGQHLLDLKFWSLPEEVKEEIRRAFVPVIKSVWRFGFEPYDCALRNILWEAETKQLSLVDFEHWHPITKDPVNMNTLDEMARWGIVRKQLDPHPRNHVKAWAYAESLMRPS